MSIQKHREDIARTNPMALAANHAFISKVSALAEQYEAKQAHPADWRRLRNDLHAEMQSLLAKDVFTKADQAVFDNLEPRIRYCDAKISLAEVAESVGRAGAASPSTGWIDAKTKQPIRVYRPGECIAAQRGGSDVTLGALIEGHLAGPRNGAVKAALEGATGTAGGFTVPTNIALDFFDKLRARSVFIQAGASTAMLPGGATRMIVVDEDPVAVWRGEGQSIGDTDIELGAFELNPRSLSALVKISYELLMDSANIESIITTTLLGALSLELDRACLFGSGTVHQPVGLANYPGITTISMGTNGAALTNFDPLIDMIYSLESANAGAPTAMIWHPRTGRDLRKLKDGHNQPLMPPDPIPSIPKLATTSVPINLTQGSATTASPILLGDFGDAILGMREELVIQRLDQTFASNGQVGFWAHMRADVGFARPASFVKLDGVIPPA